VRKARKRFQTGREILEAYVPGYAPPTRTAEGRPGLGVTPGDEAAQKLLEQLKERLGRKRIQASRARRDTSH
jgi:formylmethanofuran:tetrahydromethanopterin formyltransferase